MNRRYSVWLFYINVFIVFMCDFCVEVDLVKKVNGAKDKERHTTGAELLREKEVRKMWRERSKFEEVVSVLQLQRVQLPKVVLRQVVRDLTSLTFRIPLDLYQWGK